jgi:Txe/YoeB family toxin of Txe-Axe toxin-antitoxin module
MRQRTNGGAVISFADSAFEEYWRWATEDKKVFGKINTLITEITRDPFSWDGQAGTA